MKVSWVSLIVAMFVVAAVQTIRPERIRNLRALRPKLNQKRARRLNVLSESFGNPYSFADSDGDKEEQLHARNMLMYMDISKKEAMIKKLLGLVNEFPEHLDDFTEKINGMLSQISMAVGNDHLLKQKI